MSLRGGRNVKVHIYLLQKSRRDKFNWSNLLRAHVYASFEDAMRDADSLKLESYQIVPVGYSGPPYWESRKHVRHSGSLAQYSNPRVFLIDNETGKRIEV
jgi:hypothetical protein